MRETKLLNDAVLPPRNSLAARTLRMAVLRISLVALSAGAVSYFTNHALLEESVRSQLLLSTEQILQRESLPFREIRELEQNFLNDYSAIYSDPVARKKMARDFDHIFYRHADGSYTQRPGLFEGKPLPDGRRFSKMSATYAPDFVPDADVKARFTLAYELSHKYGSTARGRLFNFYGVVPEKGFPIYQDADIAQAFVYSGPEMLKLETYEFYSRGFDPVQHDTFFTKMYWDFSNNALMTTVATPGLADASGRHRILAAVDVLLDELTNRVSHPPMLGTHSTLFMADEEGTLIYHTEHMEAIKQSEGKASLKSLKLEKEYGLLKIGRGLAPGKVSVHDNGNEIVAIGRLPETPGVLSIHYPKSMMRPAILQNLGIVVALGLFTLLIEIFIIRSVLQNQVAAPLARLIRAARLVGAGDSYLDRKFIPLESHDEIGELARDFAQMADRVHDMQEALERRVKARTSQLEDANRKLQAISATDGLTGLPNRRRFDEVLSNEWRRAQRSGDHLWLAMIDVDWFKQYNDHYGHLAGDDCLRSVAGLLQEHAHRAGDMVARYGGEEFALIFTSTDIDHALRYTRLICESLARAALPHVKSPFGHITASIGIAGTLPDEGMTSDELLAQADSALYRAKQEGRNQVCQYQKEIHCPL